MLKRLNPTLFHVVCNANVAGRECQMIGNRFLLDIPDKVAVIIHHNYSLDECRQLCRQWFAVGENGGVLVGTAIAPLEKKIIKEAVGRGYRVILLSPNGFPAGYKPSGTVFDACAKGQLLQVGLDFGGSERTAITREQCLLLNQLAEDITML